MEKTIPRVLLAGTGSGCGKTTAACAVLQALVNRGLNAGAFKCGPDYIDPMFHSRIIGAGSGNLDPFFFDRNTLRYLLAKNSRDRDVSVIEGVMGYYDGAGLASTLASSQLRLNVNQEIDLLACALDGLFRCRRVPAPGGAALPQGFLGIVGPQTAGTGETLLSGGTEG